MAITAPTLILHGEADNLVPVAHAHKFADAIPGAQLKLYPDVGHIPQEEISETSLADLKAFLSGVYAAPEPAEAVLTEGE